MTTALHQNKTLFFRYVDLILRLLFKNAFSLLKPNCSSPISLDNLTFFFGFFWGIASQNFGKHDCRQECRLMAVFASIHNRHRHSRVLLPCVVCPSLSLIAFFLRRNKKK